MKNKISLTYTHSIEDKRRFMHNRRRDLFKDLQVDHEVIINDPDYSKMLEQMIDDWNIRVSKRQIEASIAGHEKKLESGYYQSEKHKLAAIAGGKSPYPSGREICVVMPVKTGIHSRSLWIPDGSRMTGSGQDWLADCFTGLQRQAGPSSGSEIASKLLKTAQSGR